MRYGRIEITKEDYELLTGLAPDKRRSEIKSRIPESIRLGYGLYGYGTREEDGKCYITYTCGDSCD